MFGAGAIRENQQPDFKGYMIGDQSLINYGEGRSNLVFMFGRKNQTRIDTPGSGQHDYTEATLGKSWSTRFDIFWDTENQWSNKAHSGTRTPTTSTSFGIYNPCPNGNGLSYPFDVIAVPRNSKETNEARKKAQAKRKKNHESMALSGASFESESDNNGNARFRYILRGSRWNDDRKEFKRKRRSSDFDYRGRSEYNDSDSERRGDPLWNDADGNDDGEQKSLQIREEIDTYIEVGEQYMIGENVFLCTELATGRDQPPFDASQGDQSNKEYIFEEVKNLRRGNVKQRSSCRPWTEQQLSRLRNFQPYALQCCNN